MSRNKTLRRPWARLVAALLVAATVLVPALLLANGCGGGTTEATGSVLVNSSPVSGALVRVGSTAYGTTPCRITGIPPGQIYVTVEMEGYKRKNYLAVVPEEGENKITVELEYLRGHLSIETDPPGAQVYLDGTDLIGETPFRAAPIPIGEHTYEIRKENYESKTESVLIQEDFRYRREHILVPLIAELVVGSTPSGAGIWINEERQEETTPARFSLPPDVYTVSAYMKGRIMIEEVVELLPNGKITVDLTLKKGDVPRGMLLIPAGEFWFGETDTPEERPKTKILVPAFYIDKYEVTNQDYQEVFPSHAYDPRAAANPVNGVTWEQANNYARAIGKRLPTEIEWEKAARGVDGRNFPWGPKFEPHRVNGGPMAEDGVTKVGHYRGGASPYGIMDMSGNVMEWTSDWYEPYPGNIDISTEYGMVYKVLRGGSFLSDSAFDLRCSKRTFEKPTKTAADFGFRCVLSGSR